MPALIEKKDFEKVQKKMRINKQKTGECKAKVTYLLSGLVFYGECGAPMYENSIKSGRSKLLYYSYRCSNKNQKKGCENKELRKRYLEAYVLEQLGETMFTEEAIKHLVNRLMNYDQDVRQRQTQMLNDSMRRMQHIDKEIEKTLGLVISSGISVDTISKKIQDLEQEKEKSDENMGRLLGGSIQADLDEEA